MIITEKTISNLIESHFPYFFEEDNPLLVEFVKQYFEWMETESANSIAEAVITYPGTGYNQPHPNVVLTFANGTTNTTIITSTADRGKITDLQVQIPGNNYAEAPTISFQEPYNHQIIANTMYVNVAASSIHLNGANNYFELGDKLYYRVPSGNSAITGLTGNSYYFVSYVNSSSLSLSLSKFGSNTPFTGFNATDGHVHYLIGETATGYVTLQEPNPGAAIYHARRLPEYKDIDSTVDEFLVYFKEKYLKNIQFKTAASTRRMVKHSLDLYRSKGTPRAIDLLFKVVFDTPAEVYLPSRDIFKLSSGNFYQQKYLEVSPSPINITFVGKEITGLQSGAKAFVERLIRKKVKGVYVEVFTISNITKGYHFLTGEIVKTNDQISVKDNPKIIGSLTKARILDGSSLFTIGDIVDIESDMGTSAKGRVTSIADVTGKVDFALVDGGFGYTTNANIYVSEKVIRLANVHVNTSISPTAYFNTFDYIHADQAVINYINGSNTFAVGDTLHTYWSNGVVRGTAAVQSSKGNTSFGNVYISIYSGDMTIPAADVVNGYFTTSNTKSANIGTFGYEDLSPSAKVLGTTGSVTLNYANSLPFTEGERVYQLSPAGLVTANGSVRTTTSAALTGTLKIENLSGLFDENKPLYSSTSNRTATITGVSVDVGIIIDKLGKVSYTNGTASLSIGDIIYLYTSNGEVSGTAEVKDVIGNSSVGNLYFSTISGDMSPTSNTVNTYFTGTNADSVDVDSYIYPVKGTFFSNVGNYVYSVDQANVTYSNATINSVSTGALAGFKIANTLGNPESIELNTDQVGDFLTVQLSANDYGIKLTGQSNLNSLLGNTLSYSALTIGTITNITGINQGVEYSAAPIVVIDEPTISAAEKRDIYINIANSTGTFFVDEIITQPATGARAKVQSANSSTLYLRVLNFENSFSNTITNTAIIGSGSGTSAEVTYVFTNYNSRPMGLNAVVTSNVVSESGSVTNLEIIDSGFGYKHNEIGTFISADGKRTGRATMLLGTRTAEAENRGQEGFSLGRYKDQGGFLSSGKKIQDSYYYQEYSYEVRSSVTLDKYEAMLKQLLHVAGTKYFAATVRTSVLNTPTAITSYAGKYNITADAETYANGDPITSDTTALTADVTFKG